MARTKTQYICQSCGAAYAQWSGRCDSCNGWNTLVQEQTGPAAHRLGQRAGSPMALTGLAGDIATAPRTPSGIDEFDRVLGGGLVPGSVLLLGGDPGIGKSTLLLQASATLAQRGHDVIYVSGEESIAQVQLRARRLGLGEASVRLACETNVENILSTLKSQDRSHGPATMVIIDSIQTLWSRESDPAPGTVTQVRLSAQRLIAHAKASGTAVVLVGHVTKDGAIAGPRVVEHMVDGVLSFEGDGGHAFRLLRALKNRFGPTDEIGVFEMRSAGLFGVANPSELFLGERTACSPGAAVFAGLEGSRPVLVEIQTLVSPSSLATPRRAVVGWDHNRLAMIIAVLETRCAVRFGARDVYLNVAGGYRISEPAADLAVAAALVSSLADSSLSSQNVYFGEISLSGAVRGVPQPVLRLREAAKLGFTAAHMPAVQITPDTRPLAVHCNGIGLLGDMVAAILAGKADSPARALRSG